VADEDSGSDDETPEAIGDEGVANGDELAAPVRRRHLSAFESDVADPVLADAGGAAGEARRKRALLRPTVAIAAMAGSADRLVDFARAVAVDPVVAWAPFGDWTASQMVAALSAEPFIAADLRLALTHPAVV